MASGTGPGLGDGRVPGERLGLGLQSLLRPERAELHWVRSEAVPSSTWELSPLVKGCRASVERWAGCRRGRWLRACRRCDQEDWALLLCAY